MPGPIRPLAALAALLTSSTAFAAGGGGASPIVIVADTRHLTGVQAWLGNVYNDSHGLFTVITVLSIPVLGVALGLGADAVLGLLGVDLRARGHGGH